MRQVFTFAAGVLIRAAPIRGERRLTELELEELASRLRALPSRQRCLRAEEYAVNQKRQVGNVPQAFRHLTLIGAATAVSAAQAAAAGAAT
jgi:hypothetical protein